MRCDLRFGISDLGLVEQYCGANLAELVFLKFQTRNVFQVAEKAGVKIRFEKWFPVTAGEFEWRTKTIVVNENSSFGFEKVIAHELGHFFIREFKIENVNDEEKFCDEFADKLLKPEREFHAKTQRAQR